MKAAYYSRNNSYSRSANAENAETENRYPLTRAASYLSLSVQAFKKGLEFAKISTSEWHHVGKYANKVDYYDVSDESEIVNSPKFWQGAKNKANKNYCEAKRIEALKNIAKENLQEKLQAWSQVKRSPKFTKDLKAKCTPQFLESLVKYLSKGYGNTGAKGTIYVSYGSYQQDEMMFINDGSHFYTGRTYTSSIGGSIEYFDLTPENLNKLKREISKAKFETFCQKQNRWAKIKTSVNREAVKRILEVKVRENRHGNSVSGCDFKDNYFAGKIVQKLYSDRFTVDFKTDGTYILKTA